MDKLYLCTMNALSISGGGFKISGQLGILETVFPKLKPQYIVGNSAGAILSLVLPTIDWSQQCHCDFEKVKQLAIYKGDSVWRSKPLTKKGDISLSAILRLLTGKPSLGDMSGLEDLLKQNISEESFNRNIKNSNHYKGIYVGTVCYNTGHRAYIDLMLCTYEEAIKWVVASSSVPVFAEPLKYNDYYYFDGGVRDHSPGGWLLENHSDSITKMLSIYSRPQDYNVIRQDWEPDNVLSVLQRTIEIMQIEISKSDEFQEILICQMKEIDLDILYLPNILNGMYDTDPTRLFRLYKEGFKIGKEYAKTIK